jgi:ComF family protein
MRSERRITDKLLDLLFPPRCPFCRALLKDGERTVCTACRAALPWTRGGERTQQFPYIRRCCSPLFYEGAVRRSLLRYKFGGSSAYSKNYSEILANCIDENEVSCDIITWAPLGRKRLRSRGYDQAQLLAEGVAAIRGLPCEPLLRKTRDNPPQSGTGSREKRRANVSGVYAVTDPARVHGRRVLLVDDIVTTGSTLSECARILRAAGAAEVSALTLARSGR